MLPYHDPCVCQDYGDRRVYRHDYVSTPLVSPTARRLVPRFDGGPIMTHLLDRIATIGAAGMLSGLVRPRIDHVRQITRALDASSKPFFSAATAGIPACTMAGTPS